MIKTFKGGNVLWISVSVISLLCAVGLLFFMLQEKNKRIQTEQQLSETQKAKRAIEIKLDQAQLEAIQLKDRAEVIARELEQEKKNYQAILTEIELKDAQVKELEDSLTNEKKQRTSIANTLAQLRENYDRLEEKLRESEKKTGLFGRKSSGVKLEKIVVQPKQKLSGKVLVVNREFHFVVIDLGKKDTVRVGDEFVVYRGSEEIGKVQVERVYDAMSCAAILAGSQEEVISENSVVESF